MTRARRLLLAAAVVCTAALWSAIAVPGSLVVPAARPLGVGQDALVRVGGEVVERVTGPSAQAVTPRSVGLHVGGRTLLAVLVAAAGLVLARWLLRIERIRPVLAPVPIEGLRLASRAPPRA